MMRRIRLFFRLAAASLLLMLAEVLGAWRWRRLPRGICQLCLWLWPENRAGVLITLAECQSSVGDGDEAIRTAEEAVSIAPHNPWARISLASICQKHGRVGMTIRCYEEALALDLTQSDRAEIRARLDALRQ